MTSEKQSDHSNQCHFFLERKKRLCRFRARIGEEYCPEHACVLGIQSDRRRIPCPLNPKHNCYEDDLQNHLRKCPVAKNLEATAKLPYYKKDINLTDSTIKSNSPSTFAKALKELTDEQLIKTIEKVKKKYQDCVEEMETLHLEHGCVKELAPSKSDAPLEHSFGDQVILKKELLQQASLVGQLDSLGFLSQDNRCFVELGAGKGKLSHWVQRACKSSQGNHFLLVDRTNVRYKMDSYHRQGGDEGKFQRIKIDIKDLCLGRVPEIKGKNSVIVIGKHLCGGATDLGIRCAVESLANCECHATSASKSIVTASGPKSSGGSHSVSEAEVNKTWSGNVNQSLSDNQCKKMSETEAKEEKGNEGFVFEHGLKRLEEHSCHESTGKHSLDEENKDVLNEIESPPSKMSRLEDTHQKKVMPQGLMIALCCHHRCTWNTYVGQDFMVEQGITPEEFDLLCRLSSWATCARTSVKNKDKDHVGSKSSESKTKSKELSPHSHETSEQKCSNEKIEQTDGTDHDVQDLIASALNHSESIRDKLSVNQREDIGRMCKRIIDTGRLHYLRSMGMICFLREYVDERQTPENVVLIAKRPNDNQL